MCGAAIPSLSWPPEPLDPTSGDEDSLLGLAKSKEKLPVTDGQERRTAALAALKLICESPVFQPHLESLLAGLNAQGNTPFMASIVHRAYPASWSSWTRPRGWLESPVTIKKPKNKR